MITLKKYLELNPTETEEERHLAEFAAKIESRLVEADKHLRKCMGWTLRASELEVSSGMQEAQLEDLGAAESFLANSQINKKKLDFKTMSPEAQRIAIKEECGWLLDHVNRYAMYYVPIDDYHVGDPLNDLNAIHEAVKSLPQQLKPRYFACLCNVVSGAISLNGYSEATEATASQRCEAFLRTIGKWRGEA